MKKKAGVYIDGSNIYHGGKKAGWLVDYAKLITFIRRKYEIKLINYYNSVGYLREGDGKYIKDATGAYIPNPTTLRFNKLLEVNGIRLICKPLKFVKGNEAIASNKLDGDLMIDALLDSPSWEVLILLSGDSDFEKLIKQMIIYKKEVCIFSFVSRISHELLMLANSCPSVSYIRLEKLKSVLQHEKKTKKVDK